MNKDVGDIVGSTRLPGFAQPAEERAAGGRPSRDQRLGEVIRRWKGTVAGVTAAGAVLVGVAAFVAPPSYTGTAQLMVEPAPSEISAGLLAPVVDTHITMLTSDVRLRQVLDALASRPEAAAVSPEGAPGLEERVRSALLAAGAALKRAILPPAREGSEAPAGPQGPGVAEVKDALLVKQERLSSIVSVTFRDRDPARAAAVANQIVTSHVDELRERRRFDAQHQRASLDLRIEEVRSDLEAAELAVRAFYGTHGPAAPEGRDGEAVAEILRQLASIRATAAERRAALERIGGLGGESALARGETERELRVLALQAETLERHLGELQAASGGTLARQLERQDLENRVAANRKFLEDLQRRRHDVRPEAPSFGTGAYVFALASVPARPSSLSPFLLLPPAVVAFGLLGIMLALLRDRLDPSFRSEREVSTVLGIPCIGSVPRPGRSRAGSAHERAVASVVLTALHVFGRRRDVRTVLVTSSRRADDAFSLAGAFGLQAARLGRRVLRIDLTADAAASGDATVPPEPAVRPDLAPITILRDPVSGLDRLPGGPDLMRSLAGERFPEVVQLLRRDYDLVILDAPPVLESAEVRLLAARVDGVILALRWGRTDRRTADEAVELLQQPARLGGDPPVNGLAVLTDAPVRAPDPGRRRRASGGGRASPPGLAAPTPARA